MAAKMCNTINQNIEPCELKLIDRYIKEFGTLLNEDDDNSSNNTSSNNNNNKNHNDNSNASVRSPSHEINEEPNEREKRGESAGDYEHVVVWDRGKRQEETTADMEYLRRLESLNAYTLNGNGSNNNADDALNSDDLESFGSQSIKLRNTAVNSISIQLSNNNSAFNRDSHFETASLSNFHNIKDVIQIIQNRLDQFLESNGGNSPSPAGTAAAPSSSSPSNSTSQRLEGKIEGLKQELQRYVELIDKKKENELRRFSENMSNHFKLVHMRNAFMKKNHEINPTANNGGGDDGGSASNIFIYDMASALQQQEQNDTVSCYYYSNDDSISDFDKYRRNNNNCDGFIMKKSCYSDCSYMGNNCCCCETNSVEYYSMLINEERSDNLLNDPPPPPLPPPPLPFLPPRYHERENISLIYRTSTSDNVIKQWQKYQLNTITIKPQKKSKLVKLNFAREEKKRRQQPRPCDIYTFTMDYHKTRLLQMKLEKERKIRFICRMFFYFFGVACFILIVLIVQSMFGVRKK